MTPPLTTTLPMACNKCGHLIGVHRDGQNGKRACDFCACRRTQWYIAKLAAAQPAPLAEALRLLRALVDRWFLYSDDLPKADVMDRLARLDAFHDIAREAQRYLAATEEGT